MLTIGPLPIVAPWRSAILRGDCAKSFVQSNQDKTQINRKFRRNILLLFCIALATRWHMNFCRLPDKLHVHVPDAATSRGVESRQAGSEPTNHQSRMLHDVGKANRFEPFPSFELDLDDALARDPCLGKGFSYFLFHRGAAPLGVKLARHVHDAIEEPLRRRVRRTYPGRNCEYRHLDEH